MLESDQDRVIYILTDRQANEQFKKDTETGNQDWVLAQELQGSVESLDLDQVQDIVDQVPGGG